MRCFVALPVSNEVKQGVELIQLEIIKRYPSLEQEVKWTDPNSLHLTLQFIGEVDEVQISQIQEAIGSAINNFGSINFGLTKIDAFPNLNYPKILVLKVNEVEERKSQILQLTIFKKLSKLNLVLDNKPWVPHLTLGRLREVAQSKNLNDLSKFDVQPIKWATGEVQLIKSELTQSGPKYMVLNSFLL